jgi:hypothetical protein
MEKFRGVFVKLWRAGNFGIFRIVFLLKNSWNWGRRPSAPTSLNVGPRSTDLRSLFDRPKGYGYSIPGRISRDGWCSGIVGGPAAPGPWSAMAAVAAHQTWAVASQWGLA